MSTNVQDLYARAVRPLPTQERLQLAALILTELAQTPATIDYQDSWSDEDQADLVAFSMAYAASTYDEPANN
jgi:hypothetical protein